ncbi:MAG: nucleotidyltransferase domain-containing protein [Nitrospirae bacterium]|nr:nucleotidyltransferase domain-containing protein [Nitrospirota bacterium]
MINSNNIAANLAEYFKDRQEVSLAFLFGSAALGRNMAESDIDVAVLFKSEIYKKDENVFQFTAIFSAELGSIIKKEVDIIPIYEDFRKPMLYYNAIVLGKPVFIGDKSKYIWMFNQALFYAADFELFGGRFQREAALKLLSEVKYG